MLSLFSRPDFSSASSSDTGSANKTENLHTTQAEWMHSGKFMNAKSADHLIDCSSLAQTQQLVVKTAITKLFKDNHFSICKLDEVMDLLGARQGCQAYKMLRALHCVNYSDMPADLRSRIPALVNECLAQKDDVIDAVDIALKNVI